MLRRRESEGVTYGASTLQHVVARISRACYAISLNRKQIALVSFVRAINPQRDGEGEDRVLRAADFNVLHSKTASALVPYEDSVDGFT